jgi:hypothetical protein
MPIFACISCACIEGFHRDLDETITVEHPGGIGHFWSLSK